MKCYMCDDDRNKLEKKALDDKKFDKYFDEYSEIFTHKEARDMALDISGYKWIKCSRCEKIRLNKENMNTILPIDVHKSIECKKCNMDSQYIVTINAEDISESSTYERSMGLEVQLNYKKTIECEFCCSEIELDGVIVEYPIGALNYAD